MAGNWIKVEDSTPNKPEILKIARTLGVTKDDAFGKAMRFWLWIDAVCVDGRVDGVVSTDVDGVVGAYGFANALVSVGWLEFDDETEIVTIPNFEVHNGETAKKRALTNRRQSKWRNGRGANVDGCVDTSASTNASTREEKIRDKEKDKKESGSSRFVPPTLDEVREYVNTREVKINPQAFVDHYSANGWVRGKTKIKDWKACVRTWEQNQKSNKEANKPRDDRPRLENIADVLARQSR